MLRKDFRLRKQTKNLPSTMGRKALKHSVVPPKFPAPVKVRGTLCADQHQPPL